MRQPGRVYVRQTGTSGEWVDVGSAAGFSVALEVNEPINAPKLPTRAGFRGGFKFTRAVDPELVKLYYGTDVVNNRGGTRKEEKHMGARKFKSRYGADIAVYDAGSEAAMKIRRDDDVVLNKADVPLIAHALFEKSGWPGAEPIDSGTYRATVGERWGISWPIASDSAANKALAEAIANLAAYNAWVEGAAEREAAEAAKKAEAEEAAARKRREHDELRTSAIALEALELYNAAIPLSWAAGYTSWDEVNRGKGTDDAEVHYYIRQAEAARAAKPVPKVGDRVRVSAEGVRACGAWFGGEVEGIVVEELDVDGDIKVRASTNFNPDGLNQYIDAKYVTILATAEDLAAEKAKVERDAGIAAIRKADPVAPIGHYTAGRLYDRGVRATA